MNYRSEELNELFAALSKAQEEMRVAVKDSANPFFNSAYANLQAIIEASRPALCKNNLAVVQQLIPEDQGHGILVTTLGHSTGQWMSAAMRINPVKHDVQSLGSFITYARRYSYASLIGVYDGTEDDDGNQAVHSQQETVSVKNNKITAEQVRILDNELHGYNEIRQSFLKGFKISSFIDLPGDSFDFVYKNIRECVAAEKTVKEKNT